MCSSMSKLVVSPFIKECIDTYVSFFPDDWIESFDWSTSAKSKISLSEGRRKILDFVNLCFINVGKSLLCGEYIVSRPKFEETKKSFEKYWEQEHLCPISEGDEEAINRKKLLYDLYRLLDNQLKNIFKEYTDFVLITDEKLEYAKHNYLFKIDTEQLDNAREFKLFRILKGLILPICQIEHNLSYEEYTRDIVTAYIEHLNIESKDIADPNCLDIFKLAIYKANFILKKLLRAGDSFEINVNFNKKVICRDSIIIQEQLDTYWRNYECIHEDHQYLEAEITGYQKKLMTDIRVSFRDMALLMDFYCTNNMSIRQIDNLLNRFNKHYKQLFHKGYHSCFDNHALGTLRNFMYNCRLSYKTRQPSYDITQLTNDITEVEMIQSETLVNNFYPYKKAVEYLIKIISQRIEARDLNFDYNNYIFKLESYLKKFDDNIEWCEAHKFYPIQLPFKECIVNIDGNRLFIPSSITRPIDYKKLRQCREKFYNNLDFFKTSQIYIKDRQDTELLRKELKSTEKRYLEIGGVLIGVVTFLFGTINIFTQKECTPQEMYHSVLGLGIVLVLFAALILFVAESCWGIKKINWKLGVCSLIIVGYTIIVMMLAFNRDYPKKDSTNKQQNEQVNSQDSKTNVQQK